MQTNQHIRFTLEQRLLAGASAGFVGKPHRTGQASPSQHRLQNILPDNPDRRISPLPVFSRPRGLLPGTLRKQMMVKQIIKLTLYFLRILRKATTWALTNRSRSWISSPHWDACCAYLASLRCRLGEICLCAHLSRVSCIQSERCSVDMRNPGEPVIQVSQQKRPPVTTKVIPNHNHMCRPVCGR